MAVCDGAGSAKHAAAGSEVAVNALLAAAESRMADPSFYGRDEAMAWFTAARDALAAKATEFDCHLADLASTALVAVAWPQGAILAGIGDGAWTVQCRNELIVPVWPSKGEYANQCPFLTSPDWTEHLAVEIISGEMQAVVGFTDGLESLALDYRRKRPHPPFFEALLRLRNVAEPESLDQLLASSLASPDVNSRSDDDKTLVIAWLSPSPLPFHAGSG